MLYTIAHLPFFIPIAVHTETGVTQVDFDLSAWLTQWPDMTLSIWATRPGEDAAYPVSCERIGDVLRWHVAAYDTELPGRGRVEILGHTPDGKRKLSGDRCSTRIYRTTLASTKEPGEAEKPWVDAVLAAADRAEAAADRAESASVTEEAVAQAVEDYLTDNPVQADPPQRGVDYWTEEDQQQIVADVLTALPTWNGGSY